MRHWVLDGYNVIHAIPSLKNLLTHDADSAREQLIQSIARLTLRKKIRCTVVFDGHPPDHHRPSLHAPVHVMYSFPLIADDTIKKIIDKTKNRSQLIVITSDREILSHARMQSCTTHSAKHFANLLRDEKSSSDEKTDQPLSDAQVQQWLKIFGEQ